ncbi:MAG TPA: hypothetical protein VFY16_05730 [Gemmatimonadaceae bacterium]|nr:hypothetical protein [Gemmatimonadaceae bacterium]
MLPSRHRRPVAVLIALASLAGCADIAGPRARARLGPAVVLPLDSLVVADRAWWGDTLAVRLHGACAGDPWERTDEDRRTHFTVYDPEHPRPVDCPVLVDRMVLPALQPPLIARDSVPSEWLVVVRQPGGMPLEHRVIIAPRAPAADSGAVPGAPPR